MFSVLNHNNIRVLAADVSKMQLPRRSANLDPFAWEGIFTTHVC